MESLDTLLVAILIVTSVFVGTVFLQGGPSPIGTADAYHDRPAWASVTFLADEAEDRKPGASGATYTIFAGQGMNYTGDWIVVKSPLDWSECSTGDLKSEGIRREGQRKHDRPPEGNDTSTRTDESIVVYSKSPDYREDGIAVKWYNDEDLAREAPRFNASDEIVVTYGDCFINPDEAGWYQVSVKVNGTNHDSGEYESMTFKSHYFPICNCEDRSEAVEVLGPPPSQVEGPTPTPTATPTESQDTGPATPTVTLTETADTATPTDTATGETVQEATQMATLTPQDEEATETDGPGFGIGIAVIAVTGVLILVRRFD